MHLHGWSVWRLANPYKKILALPGLEKEDIVAVIELSELVELVELRLGVELGIFSAVG